MTTKKFEELKDYDVNLIKNNINFIKNKINSVTSKINKNPKDIFLMAVTKNVKPEVVNIAIEQGICLLGENKVQELKQKFDKYNKNNLKIHFIGHLQTNKVKDVITLVDCIESVDRLKLAKIISKQATKINKTISIFLEINIGNELNKFGFLQNEILDNIVLISKLPNIKINGLMVIPPKENVTYYFKQMQTIYIDISNKKIDNVNMKFLSMGMSNDFEEAIKYGANIVRIGRLLFGDR